MAFPTVQDSDTKNGTQTSNSNSWTLTYPTNIAAGDLLIAFVGSDGQPSPTFPTGWTAIGAGRWLATASAATLIAYYKIADGTESGNFTLSLSTSEQGAWRIVRITGWHGTTPPEAGTANANNTDTPDPPSLSPSWGAADTLWFAAEAADGGATSVSTYPTNYTNGFSDSSGGGTGGHLGTARRNVNATSEDPGTFLLSATEQWAAQTIAVRPGSNDRRGRVSFAELEAPNAPRRARVSFAELEAPDVPAQADVIHSNTRQTTSSGSFVALNPRFALRPQAAGDYVALVQVGVDRDSDVTAALQTISVRLVKNGSAVGGSQTDIFIDSSFSADAGGASWPGFIVVPLPNLVTTDVIELQWLTSGGDAAGINHRTLHLIPIDEANVTHVEETASATFDTNGAESLITGATNDLTNTPGAGTYVVLLRADHDLNGASEFELLNQIMIYAAGSRVDRTIRGFRWDSSANQGGGYGLFAAAVITVGAGEAIQGRILTPTGTANSVDLVRRSLTLLKVDPGQVAEKSATASHTITGASYAVVDSLTETINGSGDPGAGDYDVIFSGACPGSADLTGTSDLTKFGIHKNASLETAVEFTHIREGSEDTTGPYDKPVGVSHFLALATDDVIDVRALEDGASTSSILGRSLILWNRAVSNDRRGLVSFAELEAPNAPRRGFISFAELEVPNAPRRALISFAELEAPNAPRRGLVSFAEVEVPNAPRRGLVSFAELEVAGSERSGIVSFAELEVPTAPRRGFVSFAEVEFTDAPRRGLVSWAELEAPNAPRRGLVSWAEFEVPTAPRRGRVSWAELEAPPTNASARISWAELEVPSVGGVTDDLGGYRKSRRPWPPHFRRR